MDYRIKYCLRIIEGSTMMLNKLGELTEDDVDKIASIMSKVEKKLNKE